MRKIRFPIYMPSLALKFRFIEKFFNHKFSENHAYKIFIAKRYRSIRPKNWRILQNTFCITDVLFVDSRSLPESIFCFVSLALYFLNPFLIDANFEFTRQKQRDRDRQYLKFFEFNIISYNNITFKLKTAHDSSHKKRDFHRDYLKINRYFFETLILINMSTAYAIPRKSFNCGTK